MRISVIALFFLFQTALGQEHYLCFFKDKPHADTSVYSLSSKSIQRKQLRSTILDQKDVGVYPLYRDSLKTLGVKVIDESRWFNAALIFGDSIEVVNLKSLAFVDSVSLLTKHNNGIQEVTEGGLSGEERVLSEELLLGIPENGTGVSIAVFDGGFSGYTSIPEFQHLRDENRVRAFDLLTNEESVDRYHGHGTQVLSIMASSGFGFSSKADYSLFITEDVTSETRLEEFNWLKAAEIADSLGVDIISSSLGYNEGHDLISDDYELIEMNGKTSLIARAANIAVEKGIVVITSVGNEGESSWGRVVTPGDAFDVITVGSVDNDLKKSFFSSVGPTFDVRLKPEICVRAEDVRALDSLGGVAYVYGTSFAVPVITSCVALLLEQNPSLTPLEVKRKIIEAGHLYPMSNNNVGYGVLDVKKLFDALGFHLEVLSVSKLFEHEQVLIYSLEGNLIFKGKLTDSELKNLPPFFLVKTMNGHKVQVAKVVNTY